MVTYKRYIDQQLMIIGGMCFTFVATKTFCRLFGLTFNVPFNENYLLLSMIGFVVVGVTINYYNTKK